MCEEKEWEIRRLASKYLYEILSEAGSHADAKMVVALVFTALESPVPMPGPQKTAEMIKLVVG